MFSYVIYDIVLCKMMVIFAIDMLKNRIHRMLQIFKMDANFQYAKFKLYYRTAYILRFGFFTKLWLFYYFWIFVKLILLGCYRRLKLRKIYLWYIFSKQFVVQHIIYFTFRPALLFTLPKLDLCLLKFETGFNDGKYEKSSLTEKPWNVHFSKF